MHHLHLNPNMLCLLDPLLQWHLSLLLRQLHPSHPSHLLHLLHLLHLQHQLRHSLPLDLLDPLDL